MNDGVHRLQHAGDAELLGCVAAANGARAHELRGKCAIQRRGSAFARHVADGDDETVRLGRDEVVEIASELVCGGEAAGDIRVAKSRWRFCRKERRLDTLREAELLLDALFVAPDLLVQPCVLNRHGGLAGQQRQQLLVILGERVELRAFQIEDTDTALLDQHRNHELGANVLDQVDVARILRDVGDEHRLLVQG